MSPRRPVNLPAETVMALLDAQAKVETANAELRNAVRVALKTGSVRQVAAVLGMSPTTIHAWSKDT